MDTVDILRVCFTVLISWSLGVAMGYDLALFKKTKNLLRKDFRDVTPKQRGDK